MSDFRIYDVKAEEAVIRSWGLPFKSTRERIEYVRSLAKRAAGLPGGFVKKIVWDKEGGYPEHAWGFVQYTVRPYWPGFGCDGTTDENVHLIACTLCEQLGIDYAKAYARAYRDTTLKQAQKWVQEMKSNDALRQETAIPELSEPDALTLMVADLYQINNRSMVDVLEKELAKRGHKVDDFCFREKDAKKRSFARAAVLASAA